MKNAFVLKFFAAQYFFWTPIAARAALDGIDTKSAIFLLSAFFAIPVITFVLAALVFKIERKNSNAQRVKDLFIYAISGLFWFLLISYTLHILPFASVPLSLMFAAITLIVVAKIRGMCRTNRNLEA